MIVSFILFVILILLMIYFVYLEITKKLSHKQSVFFKAVLLFIFVLAVALRPQFSWDTSAYIGYFYRIGKCKFFAIDGNYAVCYEFLNKICYILFLGNIRFLFATIALINCLIILYCFRKKNISSTIPLCLYIVMYGIFYNYTVLRAGLALSFIILGIKLSEKNKIYFLLCFIIAINFHTSSAMGIIVFPFLFYKKKVIKSKNFYSIWLLIIMFFYVTKISDNLIFHFFVAGFKYHWFPSFLQKYSTYFDTLEISHNISYMFLSIFIFTLYLIRHDKSINAIHIRIYMVGLTIFSIFSSSLIMTRATDFITCANLFLLSDFFVIRMHKIKTICNSHFICNKLLASKIRVYSIKHYYILIGLILLYFIFFGRMLLLVK